MKTDGDIAAIRFNLGNRIKILRDEQDLSQRTLANMINMDRTYIIGIEKGRRNVSIDNLSKIARGLGISLSELFRDVDEEEAIARRLILMEEMEREQKKLELEQKKLAEDQGQV